MAFLSIISFFGFLIAIAVAAVLIYALVLAIRFLQRGIRALDIYLAEKEPGRYMSGR